MLRTTALVAAVLLAEVAVLGVVAWSGAFEPAADEPHGKMTHGFLEFVRERSVVVRSNKIELPNLDDPELVRAGAGNYDAMCAGCHLAPGVADSELQRGLNPTPPNLSEGEVLAAERAFWTIKHGVKMTGMPAWGESMDDAAIWGMTAFVRQLPTLTAEQYVALVASSGGHDHGGVASAGMANDDHAGDAHGAGDHPGGVDDAPGATRAMDHGAAPGAEEDAHTGHQASAGGMAEPAATGDHARHGAASTEAAKPDHSAMQGMDHASPAAGSAPAMDHSAMGHDMAGMAEPPTVRPARRISGPAEAALQAFADALQVGNVPLATERLAPDLVVSEADHVEWSREAYVRGHMKADMALLKNADVELVDRRVDERGGEAVIVSDLRVRTTGAGETVDVVRRETAKLRQTEDGWKIVELAWESRPAPERAPMTH